MLGERGDRYQRLECLGQRPVGGKFVEVRASNSSVASASNAALSPTGGRALLRATSSKTVTAPSTAALDTQERRRHRCPKHIDDRDAFGG